MSSKRNGYQPHLLSRQDLGGYYSWTLTDEYNERHTVDESDIAQRFAEANTVIDGTDGMNLAPRRHLKREKGQYQECQKRTIPNDEPFIPDFSEFIVKGE